MKSSTIMTKPCPKLYSQSYQQLIESIEKDTQLAQNVVENAKSKRYFDSPLANFSKFDISPWPMIISPQMSGQFDDFIADVSRILYQGIRLYFDGDEQKFADYFNQPPELLKMLDSDMVDTTYLVARHDVMLTNTVPKLMEVNAGSALGGWELNMLQQWSNEMVAGVTDKPCEHISIPVLNQLFNYLAWAIANLVDQGSTNTSGNILMTYIANDQVFSLEQVQFHLQAMYEAAPDYRGGRILMTNSVSGIDIDHDYIPSFQGEQFSAILMPPSALYGPLSMPLTDCVLAGQLVYPDSPIYTILGHKSCIGLVHDAKVKMALSEQDQAFVDKYIPFTATLDCQRVLYQGKEQTLEQLLLDNKDDFVVKKSNSLQGKDVVVGVFADHDDWEMQIEMLLGNGHWVAQQYCPPDKMLAADHLSVVDVYEPVWGIFALTNKYCGGFVRAATQAKSTGVINSATGALEFVVLEEQRLDASGEQTSSEKIPSEKTVKNQVTENQQLTSAPTPQQSAWYNTLYYSRSYAKVNEVLAQKLANGQSADVRLMVASAPDFKLPCFAVHGLTHYPVSPWPMIINPAKVASFQEFCLQTNYILRKIIPLYFAKQFSADEQAQAFAQYFNEPTLVYDLFSSAEINFDNLLVRYDVVLTDGLVKLVEINCGSALGGWEMELIEPRIKYHLQQLADLDVDKFQCRAFLQFLFNNMAENIAKLPCDDNSGNILFVSGPLDDASIELFENDLRPFYQDCEYYQQGNVVLCCDVSRIEFEPDGRCHFNGQTFNGVIMPDMDSHHELSMQFTASVMAGCMVSPDCLLFRPFGSKALLALFSEPQVLQQLASEEREFISKHIPFAAKMERDEVVYQGKVCHLEQLLLEQQQDFVIKKADSSQGADVIIGRFVDPEDWQDSVEMLIGNSHWIAQQYFKPDTIMACEMACEVGQYDPVWGLFSVKGNFAGSYVRAKIQGEGVINTACGAVMYPVIEVEQNYDRKLPVTTTPKHHGQVPLQYVGLDEAASINQVYSQGFTRLCEGFLHSSRGLNETVEDYFVDMPGFAYPLLARVLRMPFVIDNTWVAEFERFCNGYPKIVKRILATMFSDAQDFAYRLNESPLIFDMLSEVDIHPQELIFRYDLYSEGNTAKMLEANVGTVAGGWSVDTVKTLGEQDEFSIADVLPKGTHYRKISEDFIASVARSVLLIKGDDNSGIIMVGTGVERSDLWLSFEAFITEQFECSKPQNYQHGRLVFFHDFSQLEFNDQNQVLHEGQVVDAVFVSNPDLNAQRRGKINMQLTTAYLSGNIAYPDSPFHLLFGKKLMMAMMHEYKHTEQASEDEIDFINRFIPWSKQLTELMQPSQQALLDKVLNYPQHYVLKKSMSSKGADVVIGKFTEPAKWQQQLKSLADDNDWMVQAYCEVPKVCLPDQGKMILLDLVWGAFSFDGQYSGNFVRVVPTGSGGVINTALGARELLVEEQLSE